MSPISAIINATTSRSTLLRGGVVCSVLLPAILSGCAATVSERLEREVVVEHRHGATIDVSAANGDISIIVEPGRTDVHVRMVATVFGTNAEIAQRRAAGASIGAVHEAGRLWIRPEFPTPQSGQDRANFVIRAPDVGTAILRTSNGRIVARDIAGALDARSSNGAIEASNIGDAVTARTTNGSLSLSAVGGSVEASTTNGRISVSEARGPVTASTTNGAIRVTGAGAPIDLSTTNGSVHATVPSGFAGVIDLRAVNGSITLRRGEQNLLSVSRGGQTLHTFSDTGPSSRIKTTNGSITVVVADE